jgi:hypothetical protein
VDLDGVGSGLLRRPHLPQVRVDEKTDEYSRLLQTGDRFME